jgi:hypothetical protein
MNEANVSFNGSLSSGPSPDHEILPPQETTVRDYSEFNGRRITIQPLHHGYHVEVGCQSFAIEDARRLTYLIGEYLKDPNGLEKIWFENKVLPS